MVVFDSTYLMHLLRPDVGPPLDANGQLIERGRERLAYLVASLEREKTKIIIPAPALSELLVRAGAEASQRIVEEINKSSIFRIEAFDTLAAIEVAAMTRSALDSGDKRQGITATWAKIKYDRQIVAIAKVHRATVIYSGDGDVKNIAALVTLPVTAVAELPLPPEKPQQELKFMEPSDESSSSEVSPEELAKAAAEQPGANA